MPSLYTHTNTAKPHAKQRRNPSTSPVLPCLAGVYAYIKLDPPSPENQQHGERCEVASQCELEKTQEQKKKKVSRFLTGT